MKNNLKIFLSLCFLPFCVGYGDENEEWIQQLQKQEKQVALQQQIPISEDADWLRKNINKQVNRSNDLSLLKIENEPKTPGKCKNCLNGDLLKLVEDPRVRVFMSLSVPGGVWVDLSKELLKIEGTFVLRGLPNNSFPELAAKILELKELGVDAQIQIDPKAFKEYGVTQVPCFVISEGNRFDMITGNVSLEYCLNYLSGKSSLLIVKSLKKKLKDVNE